MSDLLVMGDSSGYQITEHYLRRVLAGDRSSVRGRIIPALERLGYDIVDDDDDLIRGRRAARGWGTSYSSADVLDYPMTLVVKLKPQGEHSTRVTFDYIVKHPSLSDGDKDILTREAEAISALATVRAMDKICIACGTESTDDSRFCRRCGSKISVETSELEVLRMSAEIRAGHASVVAAFLAAGASFGLTGAALIAAISAGIVFGKGIGALLTIGCILSFLSIVFVAFGWNRVSRALKRPNSDDDTTLDTPPPILRDDHVPMISPGSVTERTTNLLSSEPDPGKTGEFPSENTNLVN